jgi:cytochrome c oxidase cbb3-type subunit I/II
MRTLGVPYAEGYQDQALADMQQQAQQIVDQLKTENIETDPNLDIIALIAYLQRLGTDIKVPETAAVQ